MQPDELKKIERRMDELAREFAVTHDPAVKKHLEDLARVSAALDVLVDALDRCRTEDMRTTEVFAALDFLETPATAKWPFEQFRNALDDSNEEGRWQNSTQGLLVNCRLARLSKLLRPKENGRWSSTSMMHSRRSAKDGWPNLISPDSQNSRQVTFIPRVWRVPQPGRRHHSPIDDSWTSYLSY
jgi:hypothetical protein